MTTSLPRPGTLARIGFDAADAVFAARPVPAAMVTYRKARWAARNAVLAAYGDRVRAGTGPARRYATRARYARRVAALAIATGRRP